MSTSQTSKNSAVFELHGGHYDALTGAYIGGTMAHRQTESRTHKAPLEARVWPAVQIASQQNPVAEEVIEKQPVIARPSVASHLPARKPQHSMTLMRHVVKSPHPHRSRQDHLVAEKARRIADEAEQAKLAATDKTAEPEFVPVKVVAKPKLAIADIKPPTTPASGRSPSTGADDKDQDRIAVKIKPKVTQKAAQAGSQPAATTKAKSDAGESESTAITVHTNNNKAAARAVAAAAATRSPQVTQHHKPAAPKAAAVAAPAIAPAVAPVIPPPVSKLAAPAVAAATPKPQPKAASIQAATAGVPVRVTQVPVAEPPAPVDGHSPARVQPRSAANTPDLAQLKTAALQDLQNLGDLDDPTPANHVDSYQGGNLQEHDIFERALAMANSHEQKPDKMLLLKTAKKRKKMRRLASLGASVAVFLLLVGLVAFMNKSAIQLQIASARAGFAASTPDYKPEGFSLGRVTYAPGTIATRYDKDSKAFSIIQKRSNWDSQTLLENFVATTNEDFEGYQVNGRTIYVYGNGKATWVNGGIWYQVQAGEALSNDQLLRVARSM